MFCPREMLSLGYPCNGHNRKHTAPSGEHMRRIIWTGAALITTALVAVTGCSAMGAEAAKVGDTQDFEFSNDGGAFEVTLTSVDEQDPSALAELDLSAEQAALTPVFVNYSVSFVDGPKPTGVSGGFEDRNWMLFDSDDEQVQGVSVFGDFEPCSPLSGDDMEALGEGATVEGCTIFLSEGQDLRMVSFRSLDWVIS